MPNDDIEQLYAFGSQLKQSKKNNKNQQHKNHQSKRKRNDHILHIKKKLNKTWFIINKKTIIFLEKKQGSLSHKLRILIYNTKNIRRTTKQKQYNQGFRIINKKYQLGDMTILIRKRKKNHYHHIFNNNTQKETIPQQPPLDSIASNTLFDVPINY
jgi:hypothetical protein